MLQLTALKNHPSTPTTLLAMGLFLSVLALLFGAWSPPFWAVLLSVIGSVLALFFGRFAICGALLGIVAVGINADPPYPKAFKNCQFEAQLLRPNYSSRYLGQEIRLRATHITCQQATLPAQTLQYWDNKRVFSQHIGQRLTLAADLRPVRTRLNPYQFDYEKHLLSEGVRLRVKNPRIINSTVESNWLIKARHYTANTLQTQLTKAHAAIILALVSGNRSALSAEQKSTMQATGTSHLLAISGLHLALVGGVVWVLFQWLWALSWRLSQHLSPRQAGAIAALLAITFYAVFTGFDVPVKRAWVMFTLLIISWLLLRGISNSSLLLAACAVIFISPYAVVSVGFYFSFIATFVVLWSARLPYSPLVQVLIMQAAINFALLPITWATFGMVSVSAFFVNLLVIPWLGLWVLPWAISALLLSSISPILTSPLWTVIDITTGMLWQTITFAQDLALTFYPTTRPELLSVIVAVTCLLSALLSRIKWLLAGALVVFLPLSLPNKPAIIVADSRYTSALVHNGKQAILLNPGRRYRQHNAAEKWRRYLQQQRLTLAAIVLENDKLTRISATRWLLDAFPKAKVITLQDFPLPYPAQYCQGIKLANLQLQAYQDSGCELSLTWFGESFSLLQASENNAITTKSQLIWQGKTFIAQQLGAITLQYNDSTFSLQFLRNSARLWRVDRR